MKTEIYDDDGQPLHRRTGRARLHARPSLPCRSASGATPTARAFAPTYFERYPNVWWHGDLATITARGGLIVHGRSDAVLNPGGVRIGTAEIYRQVEKIEEVAESIAIAQQWQGDVRIVLFVRLRDGLTLDEKLREKIRGTIRAQHDAASRACAHRAGAGPAAHDQRQAGRARGPRRRARPAGEEPRCARESAGARLSSKICPSCRRERSRDALRSASALAWATAARPCAAAGRRAVR